MTAIISFALANPILAMIGGAIPVFWIALKVHGRMQYKKGVKDTKAIQRKADREGAKHARKTAEQSLRDSDGVDADELLDRTNGLRD